MGNKSKNSLPASERILNILKAQGPKTASDIAQLLGITGEGARLHLMKMAESGLLQSSSESRGVGRPATVWRLTEAGNAQFPNAHEDFTLQLLSTIKAEFGDFVLEKLIEKRGEDILLKYTNELKDCVTLEDKLARFAAIRRQEGYIAEWLKDESGYLFVENHCPICAAATTTPGICKSELNILKQVLGKEVDVKRVDHILDGARRCAYRVTVL